MGEWEHISDSIYQRDILDTSPVLQMIQSSGTRVGICTGLRLSPSKGSSINLNWLKKRWKLLLNHAPVLTIYWNDNLEPPRLEYDEKIVTDQYVDEKFLIHEPMENPYRWIMESKAPRTKNDTACLDVFPDQDKKGDYWIFIRGIHTLLDVTGIYQLLNKLLSNEDLPKAKLDDLPGSLSSYGIKDRPRTYQTPGKPYHLLPDPSSSEIASTYRYDFSKEETSQMLSTIKSNGVTVGLTFLGAALLAMHIHSGIGITKNEEEEKEGEENGNEMFLPGILIRNLYKSAPPEKVKLGLKFLVTAPVCPTLLSLNHLLDLYKSKNIKPKDLVEINKDCLKTSETDHANRVMKPNVILPMFSLLGLLEMIKPVYKVQGEGEGGGWSMEVSDLSWGAMFHLDCLSFNLHTFDGRLTMVSNARNLKEHKEIWETGLDIIKQATGVMCNDFPMLE